MQESERCCGFVQGDFIGTGHRCSRRGTVKHGDKAYCKQHSPEERDARREAWQAKFNAKLAADDAIKAEAHRLATLLGVEGCADYDSVKNKYVRELIISFEDAEKLIARLRKEN